MSKVVKKIGKAIGKVVKGVVKGVKKVVKKIAKSKFFRVIATAALVYFGGAALMGGFSTIGTSTSFLQGMSTGLSNAWAGVTGATSSALSGNFAQAGSQLAAGAKGAAINTTTGTITNAAGTSIGTAKSFAPAVANTTNVAPTVANASGVNVNAMNLNAGPLNTAGSLPGQTNFVGQAAQSGANVNAALGQAGMAPVPSTLGQAGTTLGQTGTTLGQGAGFTPGVSNATLNQMQINAAQQTLANTAPLAGSQAPQAAGFFSDPLVKYGAMMTGGGLISGYAQGKMAQDAAREAQEAEEARIRAMNENIGTYIGMPVYNPVTGRYEYQSPALEYDQYGNPSLGGGG